MLKLVKRPKSPFWIARGTINGKRVEVSTGCARKDDAKQELARIIAEQTSDQIGDAGITFMQAATIYIEQGGFAYHMARMMDHFGDTPVAHIKAADVRRAANKMFPDASPATVRRHLYTPLKAIINCAADDDLCARPAFKSPKGDNVRTHFFTPEQADALIQALASNRNPYLAPLVTFLIGQGCRVGETLALDTADINLAARYAILRDTKNGHERRVTLIPRVVAALSTLPTIRAPGPVFRRHDGELFPSSDQSGGWQIKSPFKRAVDRIGLEPSSYTPHTCRHTWATWFYAQTKDVLRLKNEGGWQSELWQRYVKLATPALGADAFDRGWDFREVGEIRGNEAPGEGKRHA